LKERLGPGLDPMDRSNKDGADLSLTIEWLFS